MEGRIFVVLVIFVIWICFVGIGVFKRDPNKWYGRMSCNRCGYAWNSRRSTPPARCAKCSSQNIYMVNSNGENLEEILELSRRYEVKKSVEDHATLGKIQTEASNEIRQDAIYPVALNPLSNVQSCVPSKESSLDMSGSNEGVDEYISSNQIMEELGIIFDMDQNVYVCDGAKFFSFSDAITYANRG